MTKRTVEIKFYMEVEYDEQSPEFQEALSSYREVIDSSADADDLVKNTAYQAHRFGARSMLEGIGYVKMNDIIIDDSMYCGITISDDSPWPDIDFI